MKQRQTEFKVLESQHHSQTQIMEYKIKSKDQEIEMLRRKVDRSEEARLLAVEKMERNMKDS